MSARERGAVTQDHLGLFDTPPDRREIRVGLAIAALVYLALAASFPLRDAHVGTIPGFIPAINAAMLVCDLITAATLYTHAAVFRSRALTVLASGYLLGGLLTIPWALTFPGAFSANGLLGAQVNTTGWIAVFWRVSVPTAVVLYALLKRSEAAVRPIAERPHPATLLSVLGSIALAVALTLLATLGHDWLPPFFVDQNVVIRPTLVAINVVAIAATVAAIALLWRQPKSVLDMWLLVAMSAWLAQSLLNAFLQSRFSFGAYAFLVLVLVSNLILMLALIAEANRLYARLALSTAATDRERDARLMAMDAVATAVAHEVGQPLTAASLSSSAALKAMTDARPDGERAVRALREALDANARTFAVIKSIRETFARSAGALSEFSLNELVRETVALLDRELAVQRVALLLSLDEGLPPVTAHRVQIQRVLINLLTNAIEAVAERPAKARRIVVRTVPADGGHVLLEVSDSGTGIAPEHLTRIFEPFFTTKANGTGIGLSLCSSIVAEHGGRLWASANAAAGTTVHLQMKRHPDSA
jgi:signal transduction histidine kinase